MCKGVLWLQRRATVYVRYGVGGVYKYFYQGGVVKIGVSTRIKEAGTAGTRVIKGQPGAYLMILGLTCVLGELGGGGERIGVRSLNFFPPQDLSP